MADTDSVLYALFKIFPFCRTYETLLDRFRDRTQMRIVRTERIYQSVSSALRFQGVRKMCQKCVV